MLGHVWSHVWLEDFDYASGSAGVVLSRQSALQVVDGITEAIERRLRLEQSKRRGGGKASLPSGDLALEINQPLPPGIAGIDHCLPGAFSDLSLGQCAWAARTQLVHDPGFNLKAPARSNDRHQVVWLPPLAEAFSYHGAIPAPEMARMTSYVNQRWRFDNGVVEKEEEKKE